MTEMELRVMYHLKSEYGLSEAEGPVAALVGLGLTQQAVADRVGISIKTVKYHVTRIYRKMGGGNAHSLIAEATRLSSADPSLAETYAKALLEIDRLKRELAQANGIQLPLPTGIRIIDRK